MADNSILPKAQSPVTDAAGRPTRAFYDFFRALVNRVQGQIDGLTQAIATLAKIVASLGGDPDNLPDISAELDAKADKSTTVAGRYSIGGGGTLDSDVYVWLKGDIETPPVMSFYGVLDATAGRGWNLISDNFTAVDNGDDTYTLDLADLADSGTGAALLKITRDAKGRISGTSAATTTDLTEGDNLYFTDARADARITAQKGQPNGLATLDSSSKLDPGQLPALAITETFVVNTEAAMLALDCEQGDVAVRTDLSKSFILTAEPASTLANWQELLTPTGGVTSFNGRTGPVTPASGDYTFAQIGSKPTTLSGYGITDAEASIAAGTTTQYWRGDKSWQTLNKAAVGLGNVDNTSDANKPVSTEQAAAIATKADDIAVLHTTGNETAAGVKTLTGGIRAAVPIDYWTMTTGVVFGNEGYFGTNGSFALSFRSNGYRNTSTSWTSLGRGGNVGASGIDMRPSGVIMFGADSSTPTGFDNTWRWQMTTASLQPVTDNIYTFGDASHRPSVIWAGTGTISTSDGREKTAVAPLTAAEIAAAGDMSRAIGTYQWLAMVVEKGADAARHHAGLTVQRAIQIMHDHGLDPMRYGFICYDQWDEQPEQWENIPAEVDDDGNVVREATRELVQEYRPAGDRYSFRDTELDHFLARGAAAERDELKAQVADLSARLSAVEARLP